MHELNVYFHIFLWPEGFSPWKYFKVKAEKVENEKEKYGWRKLTDWKGPWKNTGWKSEVTQFIWQEVTCSPGQAQSKGHWSELHVKCTKGLSGSRKVQGKGCFQEQLTGEGQYSLKPSWEIIDNSNQGAFTRGGTEFYLEGPSEVLNFQVHMWEGESQVVQGRLIEKDF